MCNSGSSALFLAVDLAGCSGDEVVTDALTFSTDVSAIVKAGFSTIFVDVEPNTYNVNIETIRTTLATGQRALLFPNLIGNAPDWDTIADTRSDGTSSSSKTLSTPWRDPAPARRRDPGRHQRHSSRWPTSSRAPETAGWSWSTENGTYAA